MKKFVRITALAAAALSVGVPCAKAVQVDRDVVIQVSEPFSDATTVTSGLNNEARFFETEHVTITGTSDKKLPGDIPGTHWMALVEDDGTTVSDVLRLIVADSQGNDPSPITFDMWSDDFATFANIVAQLPEEYDTLKEDGTLQSVGHGHLFNDNSGKLQIFVLSDEEDVQQPPTSVPTPDGGATVMLLGLACAGIASVRRISK